MSILHSVLSQTTQRTWRNPEDVQWFLLWLLGPGGAVALFLGWIMILRLNRRQERTEDRATTAEVKVAKVEGKAEEISSKTNNLAATNERQQATLDDLNRSVPPKA